MTVIAAMNAVTATAFLLAAGLAAATPTCDDGALTRGSRTLLVLAFGAYFVIGVGNVMQYTGISTFIDENLQDFLKTLFMPLLAYTAYVMRLTMRMRELRQSTRMMQAQYDMLSTMFEGVPTGIVLVDGDGRIHLANSPAKEMLRLKMDEVSCHFMAAPGTTWWNADGTDSEAVPLFSDNCSGGEHRECPRVVSWPDGTRQTFSFSCFPMQDRLGGVASSMLAFERAQQ